MYAARYYLKLMVRRVKWCGSEWSTEPWTRSLAGSRVRMRTSACSRVGDQADHHWENEGDCVWGRGCRHQGALQVDHHLAKEEVRGRELVWGGGDERTCAREGGLVAGCEVRCEPDFGHAQQREVKERHDQDAPPQALVQDCDRALEGNVACGDREEGQQPAPPHVQWSVWELAHGFGRQQLRDQGRGQKVGYHQDQGRSRRHPWLRGHEQLLGVHVLVQHQGGHAREVRWGTAWSRRQTESSRRPWSRSRPTLGPESELVHKLPLGQIPTQSLSLGLLAHMLTLMNRSMMTLMSRIRRLHPYSILFLGRVPGPYPHSSPYRSARSCWRPWLWTWTPCNHYRKCASSKSLITCTGSLMHELGDVLASTHAAEPPQVHGFTLVAAPLSPHHQVRLLLSILSQALVVAVEVDWGLVLVSAADTVQVLVHMHAPVHNHHPVTEPVHVHVAGHDSVLDHGQVHVSEWYMYSDKDLHAQV